MKSDVNKEETATSRDRPVKCKNSEALIFDMKLSYLPSVKKEKLTALISVFKRLSSDVSNRKTLLYHNVEVGYATAIKWHPHRINSQKANLLWEAINFKENGIIELSQRDWSSPCALLDKPDGSLRFCTDYLMVNTMTKTDFHPILQMDDCIDKVGKARYVLKCDLLKGYCCGPQTEKAKEISALVTPNGIYSSCGIKMNMKTPFVCLMNQCLSDIPCVDTHINEIVVDSDLWPEYTASLRKVFARLKYSNLTQTIW